MVLQLCELALPWAAGFTPALGWRWPRGAGRGIEVPAAHRQGKDELFHHQGPTNRGFGDRAPADKGRVTNTDEDDDDEGHGRMHKPYTPRVLTLHLALGRVMGGDVDVGFTMRRQREVVMK